MQRQLELQKNQLAASGGDAAEKVKTLEQSIKYKDERIARLMEILNSNPGVGTSPASANEIKRLQGEVDALRNAAVESASLQRRINDLLAQEKSLKGQLAESTSLLDLRSQQVCDALAAISVETLTPIEAMNALYKLKMMLN